METYHFAKRVLVCLTAFLIVDGPAIAAGPYQATGFKVGEVTDTTAIAWTRLTLRAKRNPPEGPKVRFEYKTTQVPGRRAKRRRVKAVVYPPGKTAADLCDAAPGAPGQIRVLYRQPPAKTWRKTEWQAVDPKRDFTRQIPATSGL